MARQVRWGEIAFRALVVAFSISMFVASSLAAWEWLNPINGHITYGFSETYYRRSVAEADPTKKIMWARDAIDSAPHRAENWVLLASAYQNRDKGISAPVISALRQSYVEAPLSPDVSRWRLAYVFTYWSDMPTDIKNFAETEATVVCTRPSEKDYLRDLDQKLPDQNVRVFLGLIINRSDHMPSQG